MYGIAAMYSSYDSNGYQTSHCIPTFYVCAGCVETAIILAKEILWTNRSDNYVYDISAYCVQ